MIRGAANQFICVFLFIKSFISVTGGESSAGALAPDCQGLMIDRDSRGCFLLHLLYKLFLGNKRLFSPNKLLVTVPSINSEKQK